MGNMLFTKFYKFKWTKYRNENQEWTIKLFTCFVPSS